MQYFKTIINGNLFSVSTGFGDLEITEGEYNALLDRIQNKPDAPDGYEYRINENGEYVLVELPVVVPDDEDDLTAEEAMEILAGGGV